MEKNWVDLSSVDSLKDNPLREIEVGMTTIALSYHDDNFCRRN